MRFALRKADRSHAPLSHTCLFLCTRMRSRVRTNFHRPAINDLNIKGQGIDPFDTPEVHTIAIFGIAMIRVISAGFAKEVVNNSIVPTIVVEIVQVGMGLEIRCGNIFRRHDRALSDTDRTVAALAGCNLLAHKGKLHPPAVTSSTVIFFIHSPFRSWSELPSSFVRADSIKSILFPYRSLNTATLPNEWVEGPSVNSTPLSLNNS